jgi:hypothetical protein
VTLRRWSSKTARCNTRIRRFSQSHRLVGDIPTARPARWTSLFGCRTWNPAETKKARSVVALSCVTRFGRGRRFASGCWSVHRGWSLRLSPSTTGVFPASCPEIHRPARNHRHVRNWARRCIGIIRLRCKNLSEVQVQNFVQRTLRCGAGAFAVIALSSRHDLSQSEVGSMITLAGCRDWALSEWEAPPIRCGAET